MVGRSSGCSHTEIWQRQNHLHRRSAGRKNDGRCRGMDGQGRGSDFVAYSSPRGRGNITPRRERPRSLSGGERNVRIKNASAAAHDETVVEPDRSVACRVTGLWGGSHQQRAALKLRQNCQTTVVSDYARRLAGNFHNSLVGISKKYESGMANRICILLPGKLAP